MMLLGSTTLITLMGKPCWNDLAPVFYVNFFSFFSHQQYLTILLFCIYHYQFDYRLSFFFLI